MSYTMADYRRDTAKEYLENLTPEQRMKVLQNLTPEQRLAGLSAEEIAKYLKKLRSERPSRKGKLRRKN